LCSNEEKSMYYHSHHECFAEAGAGREKSCVRSCEPCISKTGPVATGLSVLCRYSSDAVLGELHQVMQRKEGSPRAMAGLRRGLASVGEWKDLYRAAMLETDKNKVPSLIAEAECAIVHRARELFNIAGDNIEEEENLDDALYALRALRSCLAVDAQAA
jgi:hypothetical protein